MNDVDAEQDSALKIGAVARLTGLSSHTLRKWESRYAAVVPQRTERGQRLYARRDVERLTLIKHLVDAGVAPRDVAKLDPTALSARIEHLRQAQREAQANGNRLLRAVIVGGGIATLFAHRGYEKGNLQVVASAATADALEMLPGENEIDVIVYECDTVRQETRRDLDLLMSRCAAKTAVLVYRFSNRGDLLSLQTPRIATMRAPAELATLEKVAASLVGASSLPALQAQAPAAEVQGGLSVDVPPPRLSQAVITKMAQSTPRVRCECPQHLADILLGLKAFEDYSEACENRNPQDAALHHYLWRSAAQARALFEDAIEHVAAAEGIRLEE
ncbi:MAG: DNA-binding transcriptional MerR regulator [Gammaproteobacteria bacterium]|jgi:DNA-binding transcriptional MerR regulator